MQPLQFSRPTPLQALLGGTGIALSTHSLLVCNGAALGVSGFIHHAVEGDTEASLAVLGMVLGGVAAGVFGNQALIPTVGSLPQVILSGLLVGVGTKLANGCTSGHMIAGLSRFSKRSFIATMTFFPVAALTTQVLHKTNLPVVTQTDWSLESQLGDVYILAVSLATIWTISKVFGRTSTQPPSPVRLVASFLTALSFGVSLHLGNMVDPCKVLGFLGLPFSPSFDPSLAFLASTALPITTLLYRFAHSTETPRFGGKWEIPTSATIDAKLIGGSVLFGIGWGICGICPGPALVNLGRALYAREGIITTISWIASMVVGGLVVD